VRILAKPVCAPGSSEPISLWEHTKHVVGGCQTLLDISGRQIVSMYRLSDFDRFCRLLITAAWLHDIGKVSSHFQKLMQAAMKKCFSPQAVRHEAISFILVSLPEMQQWLKQGLTDIDYTILKWVIAGHHRKFPPEDIKDDAPIEMIVHADAPDVQMILNETRVHLGLADSLSLPRIKFNCNKINIWQTDRDVMAHLTNKKVQEGRHLMSKEEKRLVAALKSSLIIGDVLGSIQDMMRSELAPLATEVMGNLVSPHYMIQLIEQKCRDENITLNEVQLGIERHAERVLLLETGCGGGKTLAGYAWGRSKADGRKLFFCYPTMGTATSGYKDYLHKKLEGDDTRLIHSTAWSELNNLEKKRFHTKSPMKEKNGERAAIKMENLLRMSEITFFVLLKFGVIVSLPVQQIQFWAQCRITIWALWAWGLTPMALLFSMKSMLMMLKCGVHC
jgi:CRISPR-associated endonuclease/helicase Cas3